VPERIRPLGWAAYGVAFLLIAIPFIDGLITVWPIRVGEITWRFGAAGVASVAIMTPMLGMLIAVLVAVLMSHRRAVLALSVVSLLGAVAGLATLGVFSMDVMQMRPRVRPEVIAGFDRTNIIAVFKYLIGMVVAVSIGLGGLAAAKRMKAEPRGRDARIGAGKESEDKPGVLVGRS
jgi:hypothetical protein